MRYLFMIAVLAGGAWLAFSTIFSGGDSGVISLKVRKNLKLVYQVSDDKLHEGVNRGLFYARKLMDVYEKEGIDAKDVDFHLVYHGAGLHALVNDAARSRLTGDAGVNPNAAILAELLERGVKVELCADTMRQKSVTAGELLPGVDRVVGAFPRLVDLQLMGYAYIKFE